MPIFKHIKNMFIKMFGILTLPLFKNRGSVKGCTAWTCSCCKRVVYVEPPITCSVCSRGLMIKLHLK